MRLNQLLKHLTYEHVQGSQSREITDICYHSGNVREGSLFVCLKGLYNDGHDYLQGALEAGAAAVVVAAENVVSLDNGCAFVHGTVWCADLGGHRPVAGLRCDCGGYQTRARRACGSFF